MMKTLLLAMIFCLCSCTLFKKTSRTIDVATRTSNNQLESHQLVLKSLGKETQVYTYWNDSETYQYQLIKEQSRESSSAQLKVEDQQVSKEKHIDKKSEPVKVWGYVGLLFLLLGGFGLYRKVLSRYQFIQEKNKSQNKVY